MKAQDVFFEEKTESSSEMPGFELLFASQGEAGWKLLNKATEQGRPIDLAFVDMRMPPGWDGVETIRHLWQSDPMLEIVICSAYSDYSWSDIVEELGLSDRLGILRKPFDSIEVLQTAVARCTKRRLARENASHRDTLESKVKEQTRSLEQALDQLTHSERFLSASLNALTTQVAILDERGEILLENLAWRSSESPLVTVESVRGGNYLKVCEELGSTLGDLPQQLITAIREVGDGTKDRFLHEYSVPGETETHWYMVRVRRFQDGDSFRLVVMHEDITEYKAMQAQLSQAQKLESIGQLAAGIAHEINTPMQYVGDNLEFLANKSGKMLDFVDLALRATEDSSPDELAQFVAEMRTQAKKLRVKKMRRQVPEAIEDSQQGVSHVSRIVRAMKELSHLGSETKRSVDLNRILETTKTVSTNEWKYVADVEMQLDPHLRAIDGLQGELNQVFLNLIVNSAHAIESVTRSGELGKGKITLRTEQLEHSVRVEVQDTGGGIPEEIQHRVFDPFFTTKEVGKGTGQGLALAHAVITQKHRGELSFVVEPGVGTTFVIELPVECPSGDHPVEGSADTLCEIGG